MNLRRKLVSEIRRWREKSDAVDCRTKLTREWEGTKIGIQRNKECRMFNEGQLRRCVHRIEKGMVMQPFRFPFGLDYIDETVEMFLRLRAANPDLAVLSWAHDVLSEYFQNDCSECPDLDKLKTRLIEALPSENLNRETLKKIPREYVITASQESMTLLTNLTMGRASVRHFEKTRVPEAVVREALRLGATAPSACNRQPFTYQIIMDSERARRVARISIGTGGYVDEIQHLAILVGDLSNFEDLRDRHLIYIDGGLSAMLFVMGLQAQGVASCCINWPDIEPQESQITAELGLQPYQRTIMLIAFGYPSAGAKVPFSQKKLVNELADFL